MFLTVLGSSNGLLEFPVVLKGIPDELSTMLMRCVLKIAVSFPLFSLVMFSHMKTFAGKVLSIFQHDLLKVISSN